jgi:hypothetical protein
MRRAFGDALISIVALALLLAMLVSVDPRVRDQLSSAAGNPGASVSTVTRQVRDIGRVAWGAAEDQSLANAPMVVFALAATVLVVFMLRT